MKLTIEELYYLIAYFMIYSFLGWAVEVVYHAVCQGKIINRGFLNGPVCPIYGCGMLAVLLLLDPIARHPLLIFAGGMLLTTLIELIGGIVLFKLFHMRWWDYSKEPFNLGGYICLRFSIFWGLGVVFVMKIVHPFVRLNVHILNCLPGYVLTMGLYLIFVVDCVLTVLTVLKLNRELEAVNQLSSDIRKVSDEITESIGSRAIETNTHIQEGRVQAALARAELRDEMGARAAELGIDINRLSEAKSGLEYRLGEAAAKPDELGGLVGSTIAKHRDELRTNLTELKTRRDESYARLTAHLHTGYGRLFRAFPNLSHMNYDEELKNAVARLGLRSVDAGADSGSKAEQPKVTDSKQM